MSLQVKVDFSKFIENHELDVKTLMEMMAYMRPAFSISENTFIEKFIVPLGTKEDDFGNHFLRIGTAPIMWSSHTDTVHDRSDYKLPVLNRQTGFITANSQADCLGADCSSGVWLMMEMIKAKVEGLYIFHRCEEKGAQGATFISETSPDLVEGIDFAIAFDRCGTNSIITHQMGERCCSNEFAESLIDALDIGGLGNYRRDNNGVYTDTAFYTKIIRECTNISVGYDDQHSFRENQDVIHLIKLRNALINADFTNLVVSRNIFDVEDSSTWMKFFGNKYDYDPTDMTMIDVVEMYPNKIARMFEQRGLTPEELMEILEENY